MDGSWANPFPVIAGCVLMASMFVMAVELLAGYVAKAAYGDADEGGGDE
jgi:hypothetical protein